LSHTNRPSGRDVDRSLTLKHQDLSSLQLFERAPNRLVAPALHESYGRKARVRAIDLDAKPLPPQFLRNFAGSVGSREDVHHEIAGIGEELHEETGQLRSNGNTAERPEEVLQSEEPSVGT